MLDFFFRVCPLQILSGLRKTQTPESSYSDAEILSRSVTTSDSDALLNSGFHQNLSTDGGCLYSDNPARVYFER